MYNHVAAFPELNDQQVYRAPSIPQCFMIKLMVFGICLKPTRNNALKGGIHFAISIIQTPGDAHEDDIRAFFEQDGRADLETHVIPNSKKEISTSKIPVNKI